MKIKKAYLRGWSLLNVVLLVVYHISFWLGKVSIDVLLLNPIIHFGLVPITTFKKVFSKTNYKIKLTPKCMLMKKSGQGGQGGQGSFQKTTSSKTDCA